MSPSMFKKAHLAGSGGGAALCGEACRSGDCMSWGRACVAIGQDERRAGDHGQRKFRDGRELWDHR